MRRTGRLRRNKDLVTKSLAGALQAGVTASLCLLLAGEPLAAAAQVVRRGPTAGHAQPSMQSDERVLHALNRLTFGPRPGDVAAVKAMGLNNWFERQLDPAKIDDATLDAKLAMFPAMQLPQAWLISKYPSQQMLRQMSQNGSSWLPVDPTERAIYGDEMEFYRIQQAKQAGAKAAAAAGAANAMSSGPNAMPGGTNAMTSDGAGRKTMGGTKASGAPLSLAGDTPAGGEMAAAAGSEMTAGGMSNGTGSGAGNSPGNGPGMLAKSDISDANAAPANHVESLFKDLEAINIINLPPDERMKKLIGMNPKEFVAFRQSLDGAEMAQLNEGLNPQQREVVIALQNSTRLVSSEELQSRLLRDIYSNRQLEAVMTDFWLNHFNVYVRKNGEEPYFLPAYERETIRPHALGRFEDLLVATAKSPAMLMYLDNWQSIGPDSQAAKMGKGFIARMQNPELQNPQVRAAMKDRGLNENYGRELMELHTLGVGGGYTQADVTQVAKVFTGWTITPPARGGEFLFDERRHEPGTKTVLGAAIKDDGINEGLQVLHILATSPATAKFLSTKLAVRFVSDDPPPALVDRMAKAYLSSDGDIKTVLRTMFMSPEFWAPAVERAKVKTPLEFVVSAVRASGATVNNAQGLVQALDKLGMPLFGMQTPNGYSWLSEPWVSTGALVSRMNFALVLAGDKLPGTRTDWGKLLQSPAGVARPVGMAIPGKPGDVDPEVAAKEARLELVLLGQPVSSRTRATVIGQSNDSTAAIQAAREFQGGGAGAPPPPVGGGFDPLMPSARPNGPGSGAGNGQGNGGGMAGIYGQRGGIPDDRQAAIMAGLLLGSPEFQRR